MCDAAFAYFEKQFAELRMSSKEENDEKSGRYKHYSFAHIHDYFCNGTYPEGMKDKGEKANFRRSTRNFKVNGNELKHIRRQKDESVKEVSNKSVVHCYFVS